MQTTTQGLKMFAALAFTGVLLASPVLAGEINVILGVEDTAIVQGNGTTVKIWSDGKVIVHTNNNVDIRPAVNDDAAAKMQIGQLVEGKGVFVGIWAPQDQGGKSLGKTFNLYAAPKDIDVVATFNDATSHVAALQNWHGHDGFNHHGDGNASCAALLDALKDGSYKGEWFIPPQDVLQNNLYKNNNKFSPENAFVTTDTGSGDALWYWSCTEHPDGSSNVYGVHFTDGDHDWNRKDGYALSTRPVRAEMRP